MADSALGSALIIPKSALEAIKRADERIQSIQDHSRQMGQTVNSAFTSMTGGARIFVSELDKIITKLGTIDSKASKMSGSLSNLGAEKAAQQVSNMNNVVAQTVENIDKMASTQRKVTRSADFSKSVSDWQNIQSQIDTTNKRQQELTQSMRQYELVQQRIKEGKGGIVYKDNKVAYAANQKEYETNQQLIASLREKQQAIVANNQALNQQISLLNSLKSYHVDSNSLDNQRSKNTLADMREYYKQLEKTSAADDKKARKAETNAKKEADAVSKAEQKKREEWAKSTAAYGQQYHNERQAMYNQLFSAKNVTAPTALADSNSAKTLRDHVAAIKELQQARLNLDTTDKNYKQNLASVNEAIKQHSKVLKEAGVNAKTLGEQTSYMAGYMSRWAQRMAFAFSIGSIKSFVEQIAEVRGQFELSERSLEAILQNKPKADEIFNKTVELAVKSPFRIKDLVDYTRQLSAYRIESDKLYDTTKRLADVSAGLGVDMGRLILAYGQVKAAAYLRGSEVRQFTEAGINMYGELQQYFKEVKGEAYTTAQIVDMISKRKVTFEDVEAIFQRMTDKGGTFYNMQEIQAETLQGKISNLKDAFDVMLNDIGKANEGTFKGMISGATEMLSNWKTILNVAKLFAGVLASIYITTKLTNGAWGQTAANIMASHKKLGVFKALMAALTGDTGKLGSSFAAVGKTIAASLPLAALMATIALVQELISVNNEYKESMAKNTKEYYTAQVRVDEIDAESKTNIQKALQDLVKEMNQKGFEVKIGVNLSEEEAKKQYETFLEDYQEFLDDMRAIDARYEANKKKGWIMGDDDIETDMQEYAESMGEFLQKGDDVRSILAQVSQESINLTDSQKKLFEQLAAGPQKGQNLIDYYSKVAKALEQIGYIKDGVFGNKQNMVGILGGTGNNGYDWGIGADADKQLSEFAMAYETYIKDLEEVRKEAQSVFGDVSKYQDEASRKKLKIRIDNEAIKRGWSDIEKDMLYKEYKINVKFDKNDTQKQIDSIKQQMDRAFSNNTYHITFTYDPVSLDPKSAYGEFDANAQDKLKQLQSLVTQRHNLKGGTMKLAGYNEAATTREINDLYRDISHLGQGYKEAADRIMGYNKTRKNTTKHDKAQRDILQERISLLKDMNLKYDELIKKESKETALSKTRKYFKEAAQNVGFNVNNILPDDKTTAKRIREIGAQYKELTKRGNAFRISADIDLKVSEKEYDKLKDDISRNIDDAFSQMKLYKKLKDEGMSDGLIKSMFGDLTKSFDEIQEDINNEFNKYIIKDYETTYGKDFTKWGDKVIQQYNSDLENTAKVIKQKFAGSDVEKDYLDKTQKLNQSVEQDTIETAQRLFKEYKQRLSDQLQLDRKYIEDRAAIMKNFSDQDTQKELLGNLDLDYKKKTGENTWKDFQNSDMYVRLFDNLDQVSSKALDAMADRLQQLRTELKDLDPTELKTIAEQINKVNEVRNSRNPFKAFTSGLKEMIKANKELKSLGGVDKYVELNNQKADQTTKLQMQSAYVESLQQEYDAIEKNGQAETDSGRALKLKLTTNKQIRDFMKSQLKLTDDQIAKLGTVMTEEEQAKAKFAKSVTDITSVVSTMASSFNGLFEALGGSDAQLENAMSIVDNVGSAIGSYFSGNWAGVASGVMGVATGIAKLFSNESKIDKEIQRQEQAINSLQRSYNKLKQSMDDAFDTQRLYEYNQKSVEALKAEQKSYEAMIKAEQGRKNPDDSKIQQWRDEIEDLNDTIKELEESMTEQLGGFGSQSNYKSAAEAFAEAWVDAFNEGSDALDALNDKFDEYFDNLVTKQLMNRATTKYIQPILDAFDEAVSEGSDGGNNGLDLTEKEVAKLQELKKTNLAAFDEYAKSLMEVLNIKPTGSSNISALQQGIQSVTESTAQALESILNSCRWYIAQQQQDVRAIRAILEERLGNVVSQAISGGSSNQMIALMEQQTGYLHEICDNWSSVIKPGHKQGGKGIKVFMNSL